MLAACVTKGFRYGWLSMPCSPEVGDELLTLLLSAWSAALGADVSEDSDFFALGGNSVAAISIAQAVSHRFDDLGDIEFVALQAIFETGTPRGTAKVLTEFLTDSEDQVAADAK